jgi:hypothetical protein
MLYFHFEVLLKRESCFQFVAPSPNLPSMRAISVGVQVGTPPLAAPSSKSLHLKESKREPAILPEKETQSHPPPSEHGI